MNKHDPIFTCVVCGVRLPSSMTREEMRDHGCSTPMVDGSEVHHCAGRHSPDEIRKYANATPLFMTGSTYKKFLTDK